MPISRQIDMSSLSLSLASHYYFDYWFHLELRATLLIKVSEVCHSANDIAFNVIAEAFSLVTAVWNIESGTAKNGQPQEPREEPPVSVSRYRFIRDVIFVSTDDN